MTETPQRPLLALAWMMLAILSFSMMAVAGRAVQAELNSFQVMFWRSLIGFFIVCGLLAASRAGFSQVRTGQFRLHLIRNIAHFTGQNLWFVALMLIPLGQLVALEFTSPLWLVLLAPLMLGERLTWRKIIVALIGFIGVLIVAQPGVQPVGWGHAAGMIASVCFALNMIFTKRLMALDSVLCVMFWMTVLQGLFGLGLGVWDGFPLPSLAILPWLLVVGVAGLTAHFALSSALGHAPASVVAPMEFLRLPIISVIGVMVYAEALDPFVFLGAAVIFVSSYLNLRPERRPVTGPL